MKICGISDIHYPHNESELDDAMRNMQDSEVVVIAGDISHNLYEYEHVLKKFSRIGALKLAVLGNHDLYSEGGEDSFEKAETLESICTKNGFHLLDSSPIIREGVGFVGNIGWYDYQFAQTDLDDEITVQKNGKSYRIKISEMDEEDFSAKDYIFDLPKGRRRVVWNDIRYIKWKFNDQGFLSHQLKKLETDLKTVSKSSDKIVYVSHHIPIKEVVYEKPQSPNWSLFNAYQGSPDLGRLAFSNSKLRAIICGHSHIPDYKKVENVKCYNVSTRFGALKPTFIEI